MDVTIIKYLVEGGILGVIAYFYFTGNKKRDKQQEHIMNKALDKAFSNNVVSDDTKVNLVEEVRSYQTKNIQEHNELKDMMKENQKYFKEIKQEMADLYALWKVGEDTNSKRKHYMGVIRSKIGDVLPFFNEEKLRIYIVEQCADFGEWIMDSMSYMFDSDSDMGFAIEKLKTICTNMCLKCRDQFSQEVCDKIDESKNVKLATYIKKLESMTGDIVNDKVSRFFNHSILFMQDISSDILQAWATAENKEPVIMKEMNGLDELRRITKKLHLNLNESEIEE